MPGPVPGARVDDDVRAPLRIDGHAFGRHDAHERVVDRPLERAPVDDRLVLEVQHRRQSRLRCARRSCCRAGAACPRTGSRAASRRRRSFTSRPRHDSRAPRVGEELADPVVVGGVREPLRELVLRDLRPLPEQEGNLGRDVVTARQRWTRYSWWCLSEFGSAQAQRYASSNRGPRPPAVSPGACAGSRRSRR